MCALFSTTTMKLIHSFLFLLFVLLVATANVDTVESVEEEPHPDPNNEDYDGMVYIGRIDEHGRRVGFEVDNGEKVHCLLQ